MELEGRAGASDEPAYQDQALIMQHYGFRSRPGPGTELLTLGHLGSPTQRVAVASETPGQGPTDQVDGEVEIYSQHGQRIRLMEDGGVRVERVVARAPGGPPATAYASPDREPFVR